MMKCVLTREDHEYLINCDRCTLREGDMDGHNAVWISLLTKLDIEIPRKLSPEEIEESFKDTSQIVIISNGDKGILPPAGNFPGGIIN